MKFQVIKSSFDGIGGASHCETIDEVLREISYFKGWDSREQLHESIRKWATYAHPGSVFCTQVTAIVATGVSHSVRTEDECINCMHHGLEYDDFEVTEEDYVEQRVSCSECGSRWIDRFMLAERIPISKRRTSKKSN